MTTPTTAAVIASYRANVNSSRSSVSSGGRMNNRHAPGTPASFQTAFGVHRLSMNGGSVMTRQAASVAWLDDDKLLVIPAGLGNGISDDAKAAVTLQRKIWENILLVSGVRRETTDVFDHFVLEDDHNAEDAAWLESWRNIGDDAPHGDPARAAAGEKVPRKIKIDCATGLLNINGDIVQRRHASEECVCFLSIQFGPDANSVIFVESDIAANVAAPRGIREAIMLDGVKSAALDGIAPDLGHNFNAVDYNALNTDNMRWNDLDCQTDQQLTRFRSRLSLYTMGSVAALNMRPLNDVPRLAWTRSYMLSLGLLPAATSLHSEEFQYTDNMPEDESLLTVLASHPQGSEGQRYSRGCASIGAAFGALHLANDHTYQQNNPELLRKARVMVEACRTTLLDGEPAQLTADAVLPIAVRTACHPFGLSASWRLFKTGQRERFIAEPLVIRDTVVPPPLQKLGIAVSEVSAILGLPIGDLVKERYGDRINDLRKLQATVLTAVPAYSDLHKHYGYDTKLSLTSDQEGMVMSLLPICVGYSEIFNVDANGNQIGAALSKVYANVRSKQPGLCEMYAGAFEKYRTEGDDLRKLLGADAKAAPAADAKTTTR